MNKDQYVHAIKVAILREEKEFEGIPLPSPQKTGTGLQQNTYAKMEAQKFYTKHYETNEMLSNEQIAEYLLSDMEAYRENIKEIIVGRLMDSSPQRIYWDAWFRGAKGKALEEADAGKIYKS